MAGRQERRKARTRQALLDAAVRLTAAGRGEQATIAEVTQEADLGFGSFYNHFESKEQLFEQACSQALEQWGRSLDPVRAALPDPAEAFTAAFRLCGRAGRTHPEFAQFLTQLGLQALTRQDGLAPRAREDLGAAIARGRFTHPDVEVALSAVAGALIGLLAAQLADPARVTDETVDEVTRGVLRMLGTTPREANRLVARPLPGPPP